MSDIVQELPVGARVVSDPDEFREKMASGRPLRIKYGIDPTSPHVHLGHTVPLRLLRWFQKRGHITTLVIGDYTARLGDPSGRTNSRPMLSAKEIRSNMDGYLRQIGKVIDLSKTKTYHNSSWFFAFGLFDLVGLASKRSAQQLLARNDFADRMKSGTTIWLHELFYPLMQAFDSVRVAADVEIGGTEQLHTLMLARDVQRDAGQEPQSCITVPILRGTDGTRRMGKTLGNYIGVDEPPLQIFGKTMSIPDSLLDEWYSLLVEPYKSVANDPLVTANPFSGKQLLGQILVAQCHGQLAADNAREEWNRQYSLREDPSDIPEVNIPASRAMEIEPLLVRLGLAPSNSAARRLIVPNSGVTVGPYKWKVKQPKTLIRLQDGMVVRVGRKQIVRVRLQREESQ